MLLEGFGVGGWDTPDASEVFFDAGLFEAGFGEVLGGSDEDSGATFDGGAEGGKVAAGFGREEENGLLGFVGDGDEGALFADFFVPGLDADEPVVGGRVGGAAEEDADEEVMDGLGGRKVGMEPELVAGLEVGNAGDGEGLGYAVGVGTGDADVDFGADEVEAGVGTRAEGRGEEEEWQEQPFCLLAGAEGHAMSLDALAAVMLWCSLMHKWLRLQIACDVRFGWRGRS